MSFYEQILKLDGRFHSLRLHEGLLVVDLKLPISWKVKEVIASRDNKIQLQAGPKSDKHQVSSFFSSFDEESSLVLEEEISAILKWNREKEEKDMLLNLKMVELKKVFSENNIDNLKNLDINFNANLLNLNGQESDNEMVGEGSEEGPEGDTTTQE